MSVGTLIFLLLIGGSIVAMFGVRRGGQSHGMGCGAGHNHGSEEHDQSQATLTRADRPLPDASAGQAHNGDAAVAASLHRAY